MADSSEERPRSSDTPASQAGTATPSSPLREPTVTSETTSPVTETPKGGGKDFPRQNTKEGGPLQQAMRSNSNASIGQKPLSPAGFGGGTFPNCGTINSGNLYERLSHSDISELREAFVLLTGDKQGQQTEITPQSLANLLNHIGQHPKDEAELKSLISAADQIRNGTISFPEFVVLMAYKVDDPQVHDMASAFRTKDKKNTGFVSRMQFCELFAEHGEDGIPQEELDEMLNQADPNGTDRIDYMAWIQGMAAGTGFQTASQQASAMTYTPTASFVSAPSMGKLPVNGTRKEE